MQTAAFAAFCTVFRKHRNSKGTDEAWLLHLFAGPVVFSKSIKLKEVAADIPMDRLLIETDSPYLTPPPYRGKRNDPSNVLLVAEELARIKNMDVQELIDITRENAMKIYQIHQ